MKNNSIPLVSVIVTTRNEEKNIAVCLESVKKQTYSKLEILVIDNNSTDKTKQIASRFTKLIFNKGPERSAQRNFGAVKARGEFLLFLDADMKLSKNVVKDCVSKMMTSHVGGIIIPEESYGIGFWANCKALERSYYLGVESIEAARFYKKSVFNNAKGFDSNMISGEDWDLSSRVRNDFKLDRIKSFIYHNEGNLSLVSTIKKKYYYATKISVYIEKNRDTIKSEKNLSILTRYKLFFTDYKKILKDPILFTGMIFMKSCEFIAGFFGFYIPINLK